MGFADWSAGQAATDPPLPGRLPSDRDAGSLTRGAQSRPGRLAGPPGERERRADQTDPGVRPLPSARRTAGYRDDRGELPVNDLNAGGPQDGTAGAAMRGAPPRAKAPRNPGRAAEPVQPARVAAAAAAAAGAGPEGGSGDLLRSRQEHWERASAKRSSGRRFARSVPRSLRITGVSVLVAALAAGGYLLLRPHTAHVISAPPKLGGYVIDPSLAQATRAQQLRREIVSGAAGEVKNVVDAVYEKTTGPGTNAGPQIIVFIGGNLTGGGSATSFINGFMAQLHQSFVTSAGRLGGHAACAPGSNGGPAECAWADGDTFGVIISPTLGAPALAAEMRQMRPLVEHVAR